jgi:hypothetical protein
VTLRLLPAALAGLYDNAGRFAQAEPLHIRILDEARKQYPAGDVRLAAALVALGANLVLQEKVAAAEGLLREGLAIRIEKEPDAWSTFNVMSALGAALAGQKQYAEAEPLLLEGYAGLQERAEKIPAIFRKPRLTDAIRRLIGLYEALDKPGEVKKWREIEAALK